MKSLVTTVHYSVFFFLYKMHGRSQSTTQRGGNTCHWNSIDHVVSIKKNSKQIFDLIFFSFSKSLRTWVNNKWCNFCLVHKLCGRTLFVGLTQGECSAIQSGVLKREKKLQSNKSNVLADWNRVHRGPRLTLNSQAACGGMAHRKQKKKKVSSVFFQSICN